MVRLNAFLMLAIAVVCGPAAAHADIFKLRSGGEVRGELVNADESPREKYVVRPFAGGELTLEAAIVAEVVRQRPNQVEYEKLKLKTADTAEDQWKLAQWCHTNKLENDRKTHLKRIVELDPDHAEARKGLGYMRVGERWLTLEEKMKEEGKVKHGNAWVAVQELERIKQRDAEKDAQDAWHEKLKKYRNWLNGEKAAAARRAILEINDKAADKPLLTKLKAEKDYRVREIYVEALANLGTPAAVNGIVEYSLNDPKDSFRATCMELIEKNKPPGALAIYVEALGDKDNAVINRAGRGLGRLGDQNAVRPLIDALVTKHKFIIPGGGAGSVAPTFSRDANGNGGAGLSSGGGPKVVYRNLRNDEVLDALVKLTGKDFDFDAEGWKGWYATAKQDKQPAVNPRRD